MNNETGTRRLKSMDFLCYKSLRNLARTISNDETLLLETFFNLMRFFFFGCAEITFVAQTKFVACAQKSPISFASA